jgi:CheY-like chemotaxis protein
VLNLASNGAQAMGERAGVLRLEVSPIEVASPPKVTAGNLAAGPYLRVRVRDTGTGISPHVMTRMFEPFFTTKRAGEGTGLGLSIVLGIVLTHGGAIDVQSELGRGTTFEVFLPATKADPDEPDETESYLPAGNGQRIAIVDDEPSITMMVRMGLARRGFAPTTFSEPGEFLKALEAGGKPFDLIVTDQTMPGMTGLELIRRLRDSGNHAPIIILSGNARFVSSTDLEGLGNVQFMPKPYDIRGLLERIAIAFAAGTPPPGA